MLSNHLSLHLRADAHEHLPSSAHECAVQLPGMRDNQLACSENICSILKARWGAWQGVLNGIDTALWDPATDPFLPAPYSAAQFGGKALCKRCGTSSSGGQGVPQLMRSRTPHL